MNAMRTLKRQRISSGATLWAGLFLVLTLPAAEPDVRRDASVIAIEKVMPSVVNIGTLEIIERHDAYESLLREFWGPFYRRRAPDTQYSLGSGVVIDEEGIVLTAVAVRFAMRGDEDAVAACMVAVLASLMVSYTRARAEALGVENKGGIATRAVRVVILSAGLLFAKGASLGDFELLKPAVYVLAGLSVFTVLQRILHVRSALNAPDAG